MGHPSLGRIRGVRAVTRDGPVGVLPMLLGCP